MARRFCYAALQAFGLLAAHANASPCFFLLRKKYKPAELHAKQASLRCSVARYEAKKHGGVAKNKWRY
jgi:hypothetical protein